MIATKTAASGNGTAINGVEIKFFKGVYTEGGVVFPINLPNSYIIHVNGVTFRKGHFEQLTAKSIGFQDYIQEGDNVQMQVVELF